MSFFVTKMMDEEGGISYGLTGAGYAALVLFMVAVWLIGCMVTRNGKKKISTKQLVFSAAAMALGMVTSGIKLIDMPMGGSVTLCSMMFICLIGYMFGLRTGLTAAVAYGVLQLVSNPYIISIPQMLTDYIFAFGSLGFAGIFANKKRGLVWGYLLGVLGRFFFTFLSGMIFFGSYAAYYNMAAPVYSFVYNGAYLGLEAAITVILLLLPPVSKGLLKIKQMAAEV